MNLTESVREPADPTLTPTPSPVERRVPSSGISGNRAAAQIGSNGEALPWTVERSAELYQVRGWGEPYFTVNAAGNVEVRPDPARNKGIDLYALSQDLKARGLLNDTLVVWGGEFGRTVYSQGTLTEDNYGRDHHPRCFSLWMAGGGLKGGIVHGETDEFSYNITENPVEVHDLHATILHCLGVDHTRLTFKFQGRHFRLTDVHGNVVREILA